MSTESQPVEPDLTADLYALVTHLHAECNEDLLDGITGLELTFSQIRLLHYLARTRIPPTVKRAALVLRVKPASASKIVDDLHRQALVDRIDDERDGRVKRLMITPAGRERIQQLGACRLDALEDFTRTLDTDEREQLATALQTLCQREAIAARRPPK